MSMEADSVTNLSIFIDQDEIFSGAKEIIRKIRPQWIENDVKFKVRNLHSFLFIQSIRNKQKHVLKFNLNLLFLIDGSITY